MSTILLVVVILVFLIVVHELGHFAAAKLFGIRVEEFGVGYPPRAFLIGRWRGTEYTINWIPFGGFVRLFGEDAESPNRGSGSLVDAPRWKQALVLVAGVAMNAVAAWGLFAGAYMTGILHPVAEGTPGAQLILSDVVAGSPADAAGLQPADRVVALEDESGATATLTPDGVLAFVSARGGEALDLSYMRAGATSTAVVRPAHAVVASEAGRPAIGVGLVLVTSEALPFKTAAAEGYYQTLGTFSVVLHGLGNLIGDAIRGQPNLTEVVGPVGLVGIVGEAADNGLGYVLSLAGFISVNLVIINLIPIPALDGGRLVVVALESAMRRSTPRLALKLLNSLGIALIILLMITVTYNDIVRLVA
jgi:regulator of sigma E protease